MSQLPEQLLKNASMPLMMPLNPNMNLINQVGIPQPMQVPQNIPQNPSMPISVPATDQNTQQKQDTSNYFLY